MNRPNEGDKRMDQVAKFWRVTRGNERAVIFPVLPLPLKGDL